MARVAPDRDPHSPSPARKHLHPIPRTAADKKKDDYRVVMVTAPDLKTARRIARAALKKKLAACANLIPGLESHYWWKGKLESSREILLLLKTDRKKVAALEGTIRSVHPYETPEFITL